MNLKNINFDNLDDKTKGMIKIGGILLGIIVIFAVLIIVLNLVVGTKLSFPKIENVMVRATKEYIKAHPEKVEEGVYGTIEVSVSDLVAEGYMKEMAKYTGKKTICTGSVLVFKNLEDLSYSPKLDCGDEYKYENLVDVITSKTNVVTEEGGIYKVEAEKPYYLFKGENVNNYVTFGEQTWRILRVDEDKNIRLIQEKTTGSQKWDNRYNIEKKFNVGINDFESSEASRIKQALIDSYNDEAMFTKQVKSLIVPKELCVGKRLTTELDNTGNVECSKKSEMMGLGLIYLSEYFEASLDPNCFGYNTASCKNYNYLSKLSPNYLTLTANAANTYEVYFVIETPLVKSALSSGKLLGVININGNINYTKGDGSLENPYEIKPIA